MTQTLTFDADVLARGWIATNVATGDDDQHPILCGTLLIEVYSDGVRLTATDRYMLLTTWVSAQGRDTEDERDLDEAPDDVLVVRDPDGRGRALLAYLRKLAVKAAKDELPAPDVQLLLRAPAEEGDEAGFPGMELECVVIEYPGHEKVSLPIVQGTYPSYRTLLLGHDPKSTRQLAVAGDLLARLGQVTKTTGGYVQCTLAGPRGFVAVEFAGTLPPLPIRGGVMPVAALAENAEDAA